MADVSPQFDNVSAMVYINKGPFFDKLDPKTFYNTVLGCPMAFEIHQSINGMYRYGYITFEDRIGIRETLPLTGNEILTIKYKNMTTGVDVPTLPRVVHFNVFNIEENQTNNDGFERFTNKVLKFHVIEAPFFLKYTQSVWLRSFGKTDSPIPIDKIFQEHFDNDLKIMSSLFSFNFQPMSIKMNFNAPAWRSQTIFSYLLQYARDNNGYGNVKLFNTSDPLTGDVVVNLMSINQMFSAPNSVVFTLVDVQAYESGKTPGQLGTTSINQVLQHKFLSYDLTTLSTGYAGANLINFDYENSVYYQLNDNYKQNISRKENSYFYNYGLWSDTISNINAKRIFLGPHDKLAAKAFLTNTISDHQFQLRCETLTYVDESINPGDKVVLYFESGITALTQDQSHLLDEQMSGAWIVEEIVDSVINGTGVRKMVIVKDSFFNLYDVSSGSSNSKTLPNVHTVFNDNIQQPQG